MRTELKKDDQSIFGNLYKLTLINPGTYTRCYVYYFKKAELLELKNQIEKTFFGIIKRRVIGKIGNRTKVRIEYYVDQPKLITSKDVWEEESIEKEKPRSYKSLGDILGDAEEISKRADEQLERAMEKKKPSAANSSQRNPYGYSKPSEPIRSKEEVYKILKDEGLGGFLEKEKPSHTDICSMCNETRVQHIESGIGKLICPEKEKPSHTEDDYYKVKKEPYWLIPKDIDDYFRNYLNDLIRIKYDRLLEKLPEKQDLEWLFHISYDGYCGTGVEIEERIMNMKKKYQSEVN